MPKKAVSLTLDEANLVWLKGRAYGQGNLSAAVDNLITAARAGRLGAPAQVRSVVGSIDLAADDPRLERADRTMRDLFAASLTRPFRVPGARASYEPVRRARRSRRRG
jgi:hypothetical protein